MSYARLIGPYDKLTARARTALDVAREVAASTGREQVDTGDLLHGLLADPDSVAARVLTNLEADTDTIGSAVAGGARIETGEPEAQLTAEARRAVELALAEAHGLGHLYMGTEHLLLGLMRENEGFAAQALRRAGLDDLARIRREVVLVLR